MKFFLREPATNEEMLNVCDDHMIPTTHIPHLPPQDVLGKATTNENPDLRDRAYMYWRMLSNEQNAAKMSTFVVGQKPPINAEGIEELDPSRLNELLSSFGSVAAVYHKTPGVFVPRYGMPEKVDEAEDEDEEEGLTDNLLADHSAAPSPADSPAPAAPTPPPPPPLPQLLDPALCGGLKVGGAFAPGAAEGKLELRLELTNTSPAPMAQFAMQFNTNILGLKGDAPLAVESLAPGASAVAVVAVSAYPEHVNKDNASLQLAFRNSAGNPYYCVCNPPLREALAAAGMLAKADFIPRWKQIASEVKFDVATPPNCDFHAALQEMKVIFVGGKAPVRYYSARTLNGVNLLIEASAGQADITGVVSSMQICAKADDMYVPPPPFVLFRMGSQRGNCTQGIHRRVAANCVEQSIQGAVRVDTFPLASLTCPVA